MRVMKGSLDMDENIICLVYKSDGVTGHIRSPGCHGIVTPQNPEIAISKIPPSLPPLQNMVSAPNLHKDRFI